MIYIRKKSEIRITGNIMKGHLYLEIKDGSRGSWGLGSFDESEGPTEFPSNEARDAKIKELTAAGCVLK